MSVDQAIECEAQAQAICMQTEDFRRAYSAFAEKQQPVFRGRLTRRRIVGRKDDERRAAFYSGPSLSDEHRELAARLDDWASRHLPLSHGGRASRFRRHLQSHREGSGGCGFHKLCRPRQCRRATQERLDVRSLCLIRETLARHNALADFAFAMQGLGSGPISLFGECRRSKQPTSDAVATGDKIAAFSLSEPEAGIRCGRDVL